MKMNEYSYGKKTYNLYNFAGCQELLQDAMNELNIVTENMCPDCSSMHVSDIDKRLYAVVINTPSVYYINRLAIPSSFDNPSGHKALIKIAMAAVYTKATCNLINYIYTTDKSEYQVARGVPKETYDCINLFRCGIEVRDKGTEKEKEVIRHFGTIDGNMAYARMPKARKRRKLTREDTRNENNHFIRVLMNGPILARRPITDPFNRSLIEAVDVYNDLEDKTYTVNTYTLHHCLYVNSTSVHKDGAEPSKALNAKSYTKFEASLILEFMGMIALGEDGHKTIHKTHQHDDIQGWFRRYLRGEVFWIPFHWRNETNYKVTANWLVSNVEDLTINDIVPYHKFVEMLSFTNDHKESIKETLGHIPASTEIYSLNIE